MTIKLVILIVIFLLDVGFLSAAGTILVEAFRKWEKGKSLWKKYVVCYLVGISAISMFLTIIFFMVEFLAK